jgi:hypothetical protein
MPKSGMMLNNIAATLGVQASIRQIIGAQIMKIFPHSNFHDPCFFIRLVERKFGRIIIYSNEYHKKRHPYRGAI